MYIMYICKPFQFQFQFQQLLCIHSTSVISNTAAFAARIASHQMRKKKGIMNAMRLYVCMFMLSEVYYIVCSCIYSPGRVENVKVIEKATESANRTDHRRITSAYDDQNDIEAYTYVHTFYESKYIFIFFYDIESITNAIRNKRRDCND